MALVRKGYFSSHNFKKAGLDLLLFVSVSVVLAVVLLVAHRRMAAQMAAATSGTSQGMLSPNTATVRVRVVMVLCCFSLN